jgi:two-component system, OmpR family, sensor kinase
VIRRPDPPTPERRALARTALVLACQIASGFLIAMALLGFITYRVVVAEQHTQAERQLRFTLDYGSPNDTFPALWLYVIDGGRVQHTPRAPAGFPLESAVRAATANAAPSQTSIAIGNSIYDVMTVRHGDVVRQAVLDTWYLEADLDHIVRALLLVGLIGVGAATLVGAELSRRSIAPLGDALARQRRFVADASHELRTPLTRLHTRAQSLLRRPREELPDGLRGELGALVRSSAELNDLVEDLLISASLRADLDRRHHVDLLDLTAAVIEAERPRLVSRSVELVTGPGPGSRQGPGRAATAVHGVESPLRRMIATFIDNAISHTEPTGRIEIRVRPAERGVVELVVADDGTGFDPVDRERIFERFAQSGHPGPRRFGLGLALAREIAADHGGTISADGRPGQGATFTVRLPAASPTDAS